MSRFLNFKILLLVVIALAFFLRVYKVTSDPPSLNWDETSIGYNAYSILKTGKDEWGALFPLHFRSYGEYKLPVQIYFSIPAIAIFGLNEFGVRITPVVYGTLTVLLLYFLTKELLGNKKTALIAGLLLAISPWHIHLTRASFESSFSVFWVMLMIWFMVKAFKNSKWLIASAIMAAVAMYTYNSARVFVPLFLFTSFLIYRKNFLKNKKHLLISLAILAALLMPLIPFFLNGEVQARYNLVSITTDPGLIPRIEEARGLSKYPPLVTKLVHNRVTYLSYYFVSNYLAHFTPDFLFINGAPHKQHHVQGVGEMYMVQAPFALLGLYFLFKSKEKYRWLLVSWILLGFIPVAITRDSIPHALRTVIAVAPYQILTALGFLASLKLVGSYRSKILLIGMTGVILIINFVSYINNYYNIYPNLYSRDWQYGYKQVVSYIKDHYSQYDEIVMSRTYGEPHMFTLFYLNWDPGKYQTDPNLVRYQAYDWVWVTNFDKFYFPDLGDEGTKFADIVNNTKGKKVLFVGKPDDFPESVPRLLHVNFLNGNGVFDIVEK